jgi:hypothetical protein
MECGKAEFRSYFTWFLYPEALTIRPEGGALPFAFGNAQNRRTETA